jgi:hypothetical protein
MFTSLPSCVPFPNLQVRKIRGHEVYVAEPKEGGDKSKALIYASDVFGLGLVNNKVRPRSAALSSP